MTSSSDHQCFFKGDCCTAAANPSEDSDGMIVGLNAWIDAAIQTLKASPVATSHSNQNQHKNIVCSQEYLSCALIIAHSLADQLCVVDEKKDVASPTLDGEGGVALDPLILNEIMAGPHQRQWQQQKYESLAHFIYVRCGAKVGHEEKKDDGRSCMAHAFSNANLEPLPLHCDQSSEADDLNILGEQLSSLLENGSDHDAIEYLAVKSATLREIMVRDMCINDDTRTVAIQALGATFFQLFSGGQQVIEEAVDTEEQSFLMGIAGAEGYDRLENMPKKTQRISPSSTFSSVEPLKSLGLPTTLCDLIGNMIACTDECITVDESYKAVTDVRDDLKLMMSSPEVYLQDLDLTNASNIGMQMDSIGYKDGRTSFYGRESELKMLMESYERSISSGCEVAMIYGASGIGKSTLSSKFAEYVTARRAGNMNDNGGGVFLSGGFDKLKQSQPFHAISSAFDEYSTWLAARDKSTIERVSAALKRDLGDEMSSLITVVPNIRRILGSDFVCDKKDEDCDVAVDAQKRLIYIFCQFVEIVLGCQEEPLILFLDDCQWIDAASVALLNQILMIPNRSATNKHRRFFCFGCCRDDEVSEAHPLILMLPSLESFGTKTTSIMLTSMSKETVNEVVSTTLSLLPRLTQPLADILYHKTKGNPLFIKQLMIDLRKRRLLYLSLTRRRWVWDSDNIRDMEIPDSVAAFIMNSFDSLPPDVLSALCALSCFGASVSISLIKTLEAEIQTPLMVPLDTAVAESIVDKRKGSFYFSHDKLHEAAYNAIQSEQRCLQHFRYGLALCNVAVRESNDMLLITAVGQINHGGPEAVIDREQGVAIASLNLDAGKKAMKMSDFFSAYSFFNHGISYLRKGHWENQYDLSLELFNLAAKCALMNAEHAQLEVLIQQVMHYAKCFEDKYQVVFISINRLLGSGKMIEGVNATVSALTSLGEELSSSPSWVPQHVLDYIAPSVIKKRVKETQSKLAGFSDEALLSYPVMADHSGIMAMELMANLSELAWYAGNHTQLPLLLSRMIQITLKHGMSPHSPLAFVQYGNYNSLISNNYEVGYHYMKLGLALMKQRPSRAQDHEIIYHSAYTRMLMEPMQTAVELFLDGFKAAMKSGDTKFALKSAYLYDASCFLTGRRLDKLAKSMEETLKRMRFHKNALFISLILPLVRLTLTMIGESAIPQQNSLTNVFGITYGEDELADNILVMRTTYFIDCLDALMFRRLDEARKHAEWFFSFNELNTGVAMYHRIFYLGLISFWIGRETNNKKKRLKWIARGAESNVSMEKYARLASSWNFQNKSYLLQAEEQFSARNFDDAEKLYDAAILSSKMHKFVNEEALANELAGHFYLDTGRKYKSLHYFCQAEEKYREWGAVTKADELARYLRTC